MTGAILAAGLLALLAIGGIAGPRLLDRLALAHRPRTGILVWTGAAALWTLGLLALGPLLAWSLTGPVLPGGFGAVCRRCLEAASPFGAATLPVSAPPAAALALSGVLLLALTVALLRTHLRTRRELGSQLAALTATAVPTTVAGVPVWLVRSSVPTAYALPGHSRVVVSEGTVEALHADQLGAVLSHEAAHLEQRHHLVLGLLRALRTVLGVVPLVAAAVPAVAAYAEMAADDAARRSHGTRAFAGALLAMGAGDHGPRMALHAAGDSRMALHAARGDLTHRVQRLVGAAPRGDRLATAVVGGYLSALAVPVFLVLGPYVALLVRGLC